MSPSLRDPIAVVAFEGWNDASDAASMAVQRIAQVSQAQVVDSIDDEAYWVFTEQRPMIHAVGSTREIVWPGVDISIGRLERRDVIVVTGPEPDLKWRTFSARLVNLIRSFHPTLVVLVGAMLTDAPHSRPTPVTLTTTNRQLREKHELSPSDYEGPTGMIGVLSHELEAAGTPTLSMWASVPHYVSSPPNPKATRALIESLEDILDESIDVADLPDMVIAWEQAVNELIAEDPDVQEYVDNLVEESDRAQPKMVSGDVIAAELQRFLRRHHRER